MRHKKLRLLSCRKPRPWSECTLTWVYIVFACISGCYGNLADGKKWIEKKANWNFDCWLWLQKIRYAHCYYIVFFFARNRENLVRAADCRIDLRFFYNNLFTLPMWTFTGKRKNKIHYWMLYFGILLVNKFSLHKVLFIGFSPEIILFWKTVCDYWMSWLEAWSVWLF